MQASMITNFPSRITMVGAGNVATHLALAFAEKGYIIQQVYSRTEQSARVLAEKTGASHTTDLGNLVSDSGLFILSVSDQALEEIIEKSSFGASLVVHTSGSMPMKVFRDKVINYGVLYPLQTFSKDRKVDFSTLPLCIEANTPANLEVLNHMCSLLSQKVVFMNSRKRLNLHLAAVIACNFSNHLYSLAEKVLKENNLSFDLLHPLITETAEKAVQYGPTQVQTGPAVRKDIKVIEKHIELLSFSPELQTIYDLLSKSISTNQE